MLIGTSLSRQLPTIRSRSQVARFGHLSVDEVREVLTSRALVPEGADAEVLASRSEGSVSQALAAGDDSLQAFRGALDKALATEPIDPVRLAAAVLDETQAGATEPGPPPR